MVEKLEKFSFIDSVEDLNFVDLESIDFTRNSILVDTNFLFVSFETHIDFISEIERLFGKSYTFYVYDATLYELDEISRRKTKNRKYLPLISKMLRTYGFKVINTNERYADDLILRDLNRGFIIATNDKELRAKIREKKGRVLYMRNKAYFECD